MKDIPKCGREKIVHGKRKTKRLFTKKESTFKTQENHGTTDKEV